MNRYGGACQKYSASILLVLIFSAANAFSALRTWNGSVSTNWITDGNWTPATAPVAGDDVVIDGGYTFAPSLDLDGGAVTINSLSIGATAASVMTIIFGDCSTKKLVVTGDCTIGANGNLTHGKNGSTQLHRLFLDVGGNMEIVSGGQIGLYAKGYVGGGPGYGGSPGYGGQGGHISATATHGPTYGSITQPVDLGSGNSINGGGALRLNVTGTFTLNGEISVRGSTYGAGGSVWITADTIAGTTGSINANGYYGGGGRVALYYTTKTFSGTITAYGHSSSAAGTIYDKPAAQPKGDLTVDNNIDSYVYTYLFNADSPGNVLSFAGITAKDKAHVMLGMNISADTYSEEGDATIERWSDTDKLGVNPTVWWTGAVDTNWNTAGNWSSGTVPGDSDVIVIEGCSYDLGNLPTLAIPSSNIHAVALGVANGSILVLNAPFDLTNNWRFITSSNVCTLPVGRMTQFGHPSGNNTEINRFNLDVGGDMRIEFDSGISLFRKGFWNGGPGVDPHPSYGGQGEDGGITYGSISEPVNLGSGKNLPGGGALKLNVTGVLENDGYINCNGNTYAAGGSAWITVNTLSGTMGNISANGRYGAGGRVAIYYNTNDYTGTVTAYGFAAQGGSAAGTVFWKSPGQTYGDLIVDNNDYATGADTRTAINQLAAVTCVLDNITVTNYGKLKVGDDDTLILAAAGTFMNGDDDNSGLTVDVGGTFANGGTFVLAGTGTAVSVSGTFTNLPGSTFRYVGTSAGVAPVYVQHDLEYQSLDIAGPGQTFLWTAGETYTVYGTFTAFGESGNLVTLHSTSDGDYWHLYLAGSDMGRSRYVTVKDSDAGAGMVVHVYPEDESVNEGHTVNWHFGPFAGTVISAW